jgi:hypothetical protein
VKIKPNLVSLSLPDGSPAALASKSKSGAQNDSILAASRIREHQPFSFGTPKIGYGAEGNLTSNLIFLYINSSTLLPTVGCVTTTSPRCSLYSVVVFPAMGEPNAAEKRVNRAPPNGRERERSWTEFVLGLLFRSSLRGCVVFPKGTKWMVPRQARTRTETPAEEDVSLFSVSVAVGCGLTNSSNRCMHPKD